MFSTFGGTKKREPLFTFKRKTLGLFVEDSLRKPLQQIQAQSYNDLIIPSVDEISSRDNDRPKSKLFQENLQPTGLSNPPSVPLIPSLQPKSAKVVSKVETASTTEKVPDRAKSAHEHKNNDLKDQVGSKEDDSIFDFPDSAESFSEIKVMVASTRPIPEAPKLKRKKSKSSKTSNKTLSKAAPASMKDSKKQHKQLDMRTKQPESKKKPVKSNRQEDFVLTQLSVPENVPLQPYPIMPQPFVPTISQSISSTSNIIKSQDSFDIFDFDPDPTCYSPYHSHKSKNNSNNFAIPPLNTYQYTNNHVNILPNTIMNAQPISTVDNTLFNTHQLPLLTNTSYANQPSNNYDTIIPPVDNNNQVSIESLLNGAYQFQQVTNLPGFTSNVSMNNTHMQAIPASSNYVNQVQTTTTTAAFIGSRNDEQKPSISVEKKRKRNLVAHLKTAAGEKDNKPKSIGFDFLSDEEELLLEQQESEVLPLREIITSKERSLSPELSYAERMELELEIMMKSEFGDKRAKPAENQTTSEKNERRQRYQPQNKVNVRVTFERKNP